MILCTHVSNILWRFNVRSGHQCVIAFFDGNITNPIIETWPEHNWQGLKFCRTIKWNVLLILIERITSIPTFQYQNSYHKASSENIGCSQKVHPNRMNKCRQRTVAREQKFSEARRGESLSHPQLGSFVLGADPAGGVECR